MKIKRIILNYEPNDHPACSVKTTPEEAMIFEALHKSFDMEKEIKFPDSGFSNDLRVYIQVRVESKEIIICVRANFHNVTADDMKRFFNLAINAYQRELDNYYMVEKYSSVANQLLKQKEITDGSSKHSKTK